MVRKPSVTSILYFGLTVCFLVFGYWMSKEFHWEWNVHKNHLSHEKSPYLLQHKDNPVFWFPWNEDAFALARRENKPVFLSIGYSTCHWCHVMEKDSFEKDDVAKVLNENYVSIKVDREERADVDSLYMNAVQAMTGGGGWPMTVLLTPTGRPFWGGTFIPHDNLIDLLTKVAEVWKTEPQKLLTSGDKMAEYLVNQLDLPQSVTYKITESILVHFAENFKNRFDSVNGGYKGAPKFPPALALSTMLRIYRRSHDKNILQMVTHTLDLMRRGGIYDQLGGGFHRYSTDAGWLVPHFEKMLYDNALLTKVYIEAYQVTGKNEYAQTAREILDYVLRDMTSPTGGFYSAEDADSEHIEGKFYVWQEDELKKILNENEFKVVQSIFKITKEGNFQAHKTGEEVSPKHLTEAPALVGNILFLDPKSSLPSKDATQTQIIFKKLLEIRTKRVRPHLDDKILTSWNGLMISAFAKGYQVFGEVKYLNAATKALKFILTEVSKKDGKLLRRYRDGESAHQALSDDYAFIIQACLDVYQSDFNATWYKSAEKLQKLSDDLFWDPENKGFFDSDGSDKKLLARLKTFEDGVTPSANSVFTLNLLKLSELSGDLGYLRQAEETAGRASTLLEKYPQAVPALLQSVDHLTDSSQEVAVVGDPADPSTIDFLKNLRTHFLPNTIIASYASGQIPVEVTSDNPIPILKNRPQLNGQSTFYICQNGNCKLPLTNLAEALKVSLKFKPLMTK